MKHDLRWAWMPFAASLTVFAVVRVAFPFDGLYGQDAFAYFRFARALWPHFRDGVALPTLNWPVGYPVAVALWLPFTNGSPFAGQLVSALACAVAAAATFLGVRAIQASGDHCDEAAEPRRVAAALAAGLTVALSGGAVRTGQVVMADGLGLGAAAVALFAAASFGRCRCGVWLVVCAGALAWGAISRWLVALLALPIGLHLLSSTIARKGARTAGGASASDTKPVAGVPATDESRASADVRSVRLWAALAVLVALAVLIPELLFAHAHPLALEKHEWLLAWNPVHAFERDFHNQEGHARYRLPVGLFNLVRLAWPDYFFPSLAVPALVGGWLLLRRRRWAQAALWIGWPLVSWAFLSGIPYQNPRFLSPMLPAIGVLVGVGLDVMLTSASRIARRALVFALVVSWIAGLAAGIREHAHHVARKNVDADLVAWTLERVPREATFLVEGPSLAFEHYGAMPEVHDLFSLTETKRDAIVARGGSIFLLVDVADLETRWAGLGPARHLATLRRKPGLVVLGTRGSYTLFRVGR